jgi:precorrin-8X/cobalt-precorrin-8 methylmutase
MFDRYVVVDWSANSVPKLGRDSIWIAVRDRTGEVSVTNLATRRSAEAFLTHLFVDEPAAITLLGVDFSLGYPAGTSAALELSGVAWSSMWAMLADRITDNDHNTNNRFAVAAEMNQQLTGSASPFWGCPPSVAGEYLTTTKPSATGNLAAFRHTEEVLRSQGRRPFSSWQLLGAGAVGSQSLLGIAMLDRLRRQFVDRFDVWPFATGLRLPVLHSGGIVVAEVWPSMHALDTTDGDVRDAAQVTATARWLAATDAADGLDELFSPTMPAEHAAAAVAEEGWVLGVVP